MTEPAEPLFGDADLPPARPGVVAQALHQLVRAGLDAGTLVAEDQALIEGVRVLAETLDTARRIGGMKGGYLAVQALPPFQRGLHALRLPMELSAAPAAASPRGGGGEPSPAEPQWFRDAFGTPQ